MRFSKSSTDIRQNRTSKEKYKRNKQRVPDLNKHSNRIKSSGIYHAALSDSKCCNNSIVKFIVMDAPIPESVYYLSCDNTPYIDLFGKNTIRVYNNPVFIKNPVNPYGCDSNTFIRSEY